MDINNNKWEAIREARSEAGKKSAEAKKQKATNLTNVDCVKTCNNKTEQAETNAPVNVNVNDNVNDKKRFTPPTLDEVKEYCRERNNNVDPERFIDFYASKGWKVGNQPMKDWKACVRTWEKRDRASPPEKKKDKVHFDLERKYDYDELEAKLFKRQKERANEQGNANRAAN